MFWKRYATISPKPHLTTCFLFFLPAFLFFNQSSRHCYRSSQFLYPPPLLCWPVLSTILSLLSLWRYQFTFNQVNTFLFLPFHASYIVLYTHTQLLYIFLPSASYLFLSSCLSMYFTNIVSIRFFNITFRMRILKILLATIFTEICFNISYIERKYFITYIFILTVLSFSYRYFLCYFNNWNFYDRLLRSLPSFTSLCSWPSLKFRTSSFFTSAWTVFFSAFLSVYSHWSFSHSSYHLLRLYSLHVST